MFLKHVVLFSLVLVSYQLGKSERKMPVIEEEPAEDSHEAAETDVCPFPSILFRFSDL